MVRRRLVFHGDVQGVGFRYLASQAARELGITGWVQNDYDGTVIMEAQGEARDIEKLIHTMNSYRHIYITDVEMKEMPLCSAEKSFGVKHYW